MVKVLSAIFVFVVMFGFFASPSIATQTVSYSSDSCGLPLKSKYLISSTFGTGNKIVNDYWSVVSLCEAVDVKTLDVSKNQDLAIFLEQIGPFLKALWRSGLAPRDVLHRYTLTINNDSEIDISTIISDLHFTYSQYTQIAKGFSIHIPACSYAHLQFYSPWAPMGYIEVPFYVFSTRSGALMREAFFLAQIVAPSYLNGNSHFILGEMDIGRLVSEETIGACSSK